MNVHELEQIEGIESPIYLKFKYTAGRAVSKFLKSAKNGQLVGQRSPVTGKVIIPPLGACAESGQPTVEEVLLPDVGIVLGFTIVHLPIPGKDLKPPYVAANILLDGADQAFSHLIGECDSSDVQIGMRVKAVWQAQDQWDHSLNNIQYFKPTGEDLADVEQVKEACLLRAKDFVAAKAGELGGEHDA